MNLIAMFWLPGLLAVLAAGWVALCVSRVALRFAWRAPLTLVAVAAIVGGIAMITRAAHRVPPHANAAPAIEVKIPHVRHVSHEVQERISRQISDRMEDLSERLERLPERIALRFDSDHHDAAEDRFDPDPDWDPHDSQDGFPFHGIPDPHGAQVEHKRPAAIGMVALGSMLLICGWLLFNRGQTRGRGMKVVTVLGLAATGFVLFSLFRDHAPRTIVHSQDRVVRVSADEDGPVVVEHPPGPARPVPPPRPSRVKRPVERAMRTAPRDNDELPARAGEIPVAAELAQESSNDAPKAEPAPAPAPSPPPPTEPAPTAEPPQPAAQPAPPEDKPAEPATTEAAASAAEAPAAAAPATSTPAADTPTAAQANKASAADTPAADAAPAARIATSDSAAKPVAAAPAASKPAVALRDAAAPDASRPEWVDTPGRLVEGVYRVSINSGPYAEVPECQRALDDAMKHFVDDYIDQLMGAGTSRLVDVDRNYVNQHLKQGEFDELRESTVGPMHQIHALVVIDENARSVFHERRRRAIVTERLWYVGSAGAALLALLSTFYGYAKLDEQTRGVHKGRLQLAATLVALTVAAGVVSARWAIVF